MSVNRIMLLISKGDKRSVVGVSQVVSLINKNPALINDLLNVISPGKWNYFQGMKKDESNMMLIYTQLIHGWKWKYWLDKDW